MCDICREIDIERERERERERKREREIAVANRVCVLRRNDSPSA